MCKTLFLLLCCLMCLYFEGFSQRITISGKVTDQEGKPIPEVSITTKGAKGGTETNLQGSYSFTLQDINNTLVFSHIGYIKQEIQLKGRSEIDVVMTPKDSSLENVVVVGYGTQKQESVLGSIAHISGESLKNTGGLTNLSSALQGQIPGVTIIPTSGEPGRDIPQILIRGESTWNGSQPLILVDGVQRQMNDINVNDISNISVLKDASATAVFGVKGANGVILITTKRGTIGKPKVSFSASQLVKSASKLPTLLDAYAAETWKDVAIAHEVSANPAAWPNYVPEQIVDYTKKPQTAPYSYLYPNVDWPSLMLKKFAPSQQFNMTVSGGSNFVKYFTSLGYDHDGDQFKSHYNQQRGYDPGFTYDRFNFRSNLDFNLTKSTIFTANVNGYAGIQKAPGGTFAQVGQAGNAGTNYGAIWSGLYSLPPDAFPAQYPDGVFGIDMSTLSMSNPLAILQNSGTVVTNRRHIGTDFKLSQNLDFITKGLSFSASLSWDNYVNSLGPSILDGNNRGQSLLEQINPSILKAKNQQDSLNAITWASDQGHLGINQFDYVPQPWTISQEAVDNSSLERDLYYQAGFNYGRSFNMHNITGLLVFDRRQSALGAVFPHYQEDWAGRITYNYAERYFVEFNGAYDGSENFAPKYRFGFFPSVAAGWMISNEKFMQQFAWLDKLKLRASVGSVGSDQGIPRWGYVSSWTTTGTGSEFTGASGFMNGFYGVQSPYLTYEEGVIGNPDIRWETALKKNLGVEFSVLKNRISFVGDVFDDRRSNIFMSALQRNIPVTFGALPVPANLGETDTKGYELTLAIHNLGINSQSARGFGYNVSLSITGAKDKILKYEDPEALPAYQKLAGFQIGQTVTTVNDGSLNTWDDVYASVAGISNMTQRLPGDWNQVDYNGDGKIDANDAIPYGHTTRPQNTYSATFGVNYKNLSLMVQFYAVSGVTLNVPSFLPAIARYTAVSSSLSDYWTPENPNAFYKAPRLTTSSATGQFGYYDGSYVRLQTAALTYSFTGEWVKRLGVSDARLSLSGNNLAFWSKLPVDTQVNFSVGDSYPNYKQYDLNLEFSF